MGRGGGVSSLERNCLPMLAPQLLEEAGHPAHAAFIQRLYYILWRGPEWLTDRISRAPIPRNNTPIPLPGRPSPKPRLKLPRLVRRLPTRESLLTDLQVPLSDTRARRLGRRYGLSPHAVRETMQALAAWQQAVREWELAAQGIGGVRLMGDYIIHEVEVGQVYRLDAQQPPFSVERVLQTVETLPGHATFALEAILGLRWVRVGRRGVWEHRRSALPPRITTRETPSSPLRVLEDYERHARAVLLLAEELGIRQSFRGR